jgi:hypothetical protein
MFLWQQTAKTLAAITRIPKTKNSCTIAGFA